jgi:AcrR family transcriptional regulator
MSEGKSEIENRNVSRLSNKESNKITKECIESALILLMEEKEYNNVTISEIVKRAGVSRTAYYRNYESKEDVLKNLLYNLIIDVTDAMDSFTYSTEKELYWKTLFITSKAHAKPFRILLKAGFGNTILEEITKHMVSNAKTEDVKDKYDMIFWSGAIYNILVGWIQTGMIETEEQMVEICLYILENCI